ncbi:phosphatase PAP2 family protein [Alloalcanivorax xenomutans]|uniref:phosphatase PAP2 family protein n=1 Tax=Alloalcanivorax xenomutans TaxID=1094342 RepID=UPI001E290ACF|nr:phosphatase PAP2 family protein [Alloalcanivorax xenomutans]MCE7525285.1 phosphatase PAP2 family protein [Alloalcanivorax xenomutans]WOA30840.1 phosphatase PAP2 family protein [Alloalcanivorax xenomutans]
MMIQRPSFQRMTAADVRAMCWLSKQPRAARWARAARLVSRLGDGPLYVVLVALVWTLLDGIGTVFAQAAAIAYVIEVPAFMLLKNLIRRPRPADSVEALNAFIKPADRFSFPSGHTAAASVMATLICVFFPALAPMAVLFALMVGASRVLLGVHYPTDILAGATLGISSTLSALWVLGSV